jgi:polyisoprenoid-binding protein YceI
VTVDGDNLTGGSFVIDMNSLTVTGPEGTDPGMNANLQGHLMSPDFFDVPTYPEAVFEITGVTVTTDTITETDDPVQTEVNRYKVTNPTHRISGNLTLKDQTKNIEFPAKVSITNGTVEAMAKFTIDRTNWGITYPGKADDLIRNEVYIGLALKANQ